MIYHYYFDLPVWTRGNGQPDNGPDYLFIAQCDITPAWNVIVTTAEPVKNREPIQEELAALLTKLYPAEVMVFHWWSGDKEDEVPGSH